MLRTISVIIPTYYRDAHLQATLLLLFSQTVKPHEIIVVDQTPLGEHDESTETFLKNNNDKGTLTWLVLNTVGAALARNKGFLHSTGDIILFIDDDILIGEQFIESHLACYDDPKVYVVTGQARPGSEKGLPFAPAFVDLSPVGFLKSSNGYKGIIQSFNRISGGNFSLRRVVFENLNGIDENYTGAAHGEDIDFALRCIEFGYPIMYNSCPWIYHLSSPRGGGRAEANRHDHWLLCRLYLAFRHMRGAHFAYFVFVFLVRQYIFNKTNITRPHLLVRNTYMFFLQYYKARLLKISGFKSSLINAHK